MYSATALPKPVTILQLQQLKQRGEKFATLALYDAHMAAMAVRAGVEVVLVGDSLGMTVLGFDSTLPVTMEHMIYHVEAVKRGNQSSLIIGDMPFMTYATEEQALQNAARLMQAGAQMVKLEGGKWLCPTLTRLAQCGIPVCGHIGLTPQSVYKLGGFKVQGRSQQQAQILLEDAQALAAAGADLLVLECVPSGLAQQITQTLSIPVIGIGAGIHTDAQVLVVNDILGLTEQPPKFSKNFLAEAGTIFGAMQQYVQDVKQGVFPSESHSFN